MWKEYSWHYVRQNRASSVSIMAAAFIAALLLSLLCSLFYNFWKYDVERIQLEEGDWQGRISGEITEEDMAAIQNFANVKDAVVNVELSGGKEVVVDINFHNMRRILEDMPRIAELTGLGPETVTYHHSLLSMYLIRDPQDPAPRLVFPFFLVVTAMASVSLIIIIHNSFAVSMNSRIRQFGIFASVGATQGQIRTALLQEAAVLSALPVVLGNLLGIVISMGIMELTNIIAGDLAAGRHTAVFGYHPLVFAVTFSVTVFTVWISAWIPAGKLGRLTPLEAIRNSGELRLKKRRNSRVLAFLFGIEGEMAGNALKAQRKALRTASLSLTFAFLAFTLMQCFFTLSGISTEMTYFEKYQDVWDIMVTVKGTEIDRFEETKELQGLPGVRSAVVYQKTAAKRMITEDEISDELRRLGGFADAPAEYVSAEDGGWLVNAPVLILDDASFLAYCRQIGAAPWLDGAVILNRIRDSADPNFRNQDYFPYLEENQETAVLRRAGQEEMTAEIPVIAWTRELPVLREEYGDLDYYELVHILPVSEWQEIKEEIGGGQEDTYIRVLTGEGAALEKLTALEEEIGLLLGQKYETESENRIQERIANDAMIGGMMLILGGFCVLLAVIGISNVFSNTLGFVRQRKREFARCLSIGMTPREMKKMFCIEALVIAGRPVLITIPLTVIAVSLMLKASYLDPMIFLREAPFMPVLAFLLAIFLSVALAYCLGARQVQRCDLADMLRDDTMM